MHFIFGVDWEALFDYIVVDAKKPTFFENGSLLKEVNVSRTNFSPQNNTNKINTNYHVKQKTKTGQLNLGHFDGPLEKTKIYSGGNSEQFTHLIGAQGKDVLYVGDHIYGDIVKSKKGCAWRTFLIVPDLGWSEDRTLGQLFRQDNKQTHFASQVARYADLYAKDCLYLTEYPSMWTFTAHPTKVRFCF